MTWPASWRRRQMLESRGKPLKRLGAIVWMLLALTWGTPSGALAAKVEHFQDKQGTVHITNVKPEEEAAPAAPAPQKVGEQSAEAAGPEAAPDPEPAPTEAPPEAEAPPEDG
jgi:hypothetical protein